DSVEAGIDSTTGVVKVKGACKYDYLQITSNNAANLIIDTSAKLSLLQEIPVNKITANLYSYLENVGANNFVTYYSYFNQVEDALVDTIIRNYYMVNDLIPVDILEATYKVFLLNNVTISSRASFEGINTQLFGYNEEKTITFTGNSELFNFEESIISIKDTKMVSSTSTDYLIKDISTIINIEYSNFVTTMAQIINENGKGMSHHCMSSNDTITLKNCFIDVYEMPLGNTSNTTINYIQFENVKIEGGLVDINNGQIDNLETDGLIYISSSEICGNIKAAGMISLYGSENILKNDLTIYGSIEIIASQTFDIHGYSFTVTDELQLNSGSKILGKETTITADTIRTNNSITQAEIQMSGTNKSNISANSLIINQDLLITKSTLNLTTLSINNYKMLNATDTDIIIDNINSPGGGINGTNSTLTSSGNINIGGIIGTSLYVSTTTELTIGTVGFNVDKIRNIGSTSKTITVESITGGEMFLLSENGLNLNVTQGISVGGSLDVSGYIKTHGGNIKSINGNIISGAEIESSGSIEAGGVISANSGIKAKNGNISASITNGSVITTSGSITTTNGDLIAGGTVSAPTKIEIDGNINCSYGNAEIVVSNGYVKAIGFIYVSKNINCRTYIEAGGIIQIETGDIIINSSTGHISATDLIARNSTSDITLGNSGSSGNVTITGSIVVGGEITIYGNLQAGVLGSYNDILTKTNAIVVGNITLDDYYFYYNDEDGVRFSILEGRNNINIGRFINNEYCIPESNQTELYGIDDILALSADVIRYNTYLRHMTKGTEVFGNIGGYPAKYMSITVS
ncbi:MAG: FapA family protein, partial [Clostridia bacterium]|nr:FapA family protein [Clostridia bacterium]